MEYESQKGYKILNKDVIKYAPVFTLLFIWSKNSKKKLAVSYAIAAVSYGLLMFLEGVLTRPFGNRVTV